MLCRKFYKNFEKIMKREKTKNNLYIKFPYSFWIVLTVSNSFFACVQCTLVLHINNKLIQIQIHIEYISVCVLVCVCWCVCLLTISFGSLRFKWHANAAGFATGCLPLYDAA